MKNYFILALLIIVFFTLSSSFSLTVLNSCAVLNLTNETYVLNATLLPTNNTCFTVNATNITLDCSGYSINYGGTNTSSIAIFVNSTEFKLTNCSISGWGYGVYSKYSFSVNFSLFNNNQYGIYTYGGSATNVSISNSTYGIYDNANQFQISNSTISNCYYAFTKIPTITNSNILDNYIVFTGPSNLNNDVINDFGILFSMSSNDIANITNSKIEKGIELVTNGSLNSSNTIYERIYDQGIDIKLSDREVNIGSTFNYTISIYSLQNLTQYSNSNYTLYFGNETVKSGTASGPITGTIKVKHKGVYMLWVNVTDSKNNIRTFGKMVYSDGSTEYKSTKIYLRTLKPLHGQPFGSIYGSLKSNSPSVDEVINGDIWTALYFEDLPVYLPFEINSTYAYFRYTMASDGYFYTKYPSFDNSNADNYYYAISNATAVTLINFTMADKYYIDDPFFAHFFAYKLGAMNSTNVVSVSWISNASRLLPDPSYFIMNYTVPINITSTTGEGILYEYEYNPHNITFVISASGNYRINFTLPNAYHYFVKCDGSYTCPAGISFWQNGSSASITDNLSDVHTIQIIEGCLCDSCTTCNSALSNASCSRVYLTTDIVTNATCILPFSNKIFDCQFNSIVGNNTDYGIFLNQSTNSTIQNCKISNFEEGIYAIDSSNITVSHSTIYNNMFGILFGTVSNSELTSNTLFNNSISLLSNYNSSIYLYNSTSITISGNEIYNSGTAIFISNLYPNGTLAAGCNDISISNNKLHDNIYGIRSNSSNSTISDNYVCSNSLYDFYSPNWVSSSGSNNTCNLYDGWNDNGYTGCRWPCNSTCYCDSCDSCNNYIDAPYSCNTIKLTTDIFFNGNPNTGATFCIYDDKYNKNFDCQSHSLTGTFLFTGIRVQYKTFNISNCLIGGFETGISLSSANSTITNVSLFNNLIGLSSGYSNVTVINSMFWKNHAGIVPSEHTNVINTSFSDNYAAFYFAEMEDQVINLLNLTNVKINGLPAYTLDDVSNKVLSNFGMIILRNANNVTLQNANTQNYIGIILYNSTNVDILNVNGTVYLRNSNYTTISNSTMSNLYNFAIYFYNSINNVVKSIIINNVHPINPHFSSVATPSSYPNNGYTIVEDNSHSNNISFVSFYTQSDSINSTNINKLSYYEEFPQQLNDKEYFPYFANKMLDTVPITNNNVVLNFTIYYPNGTLCTNYTYKMLLGAKDVTSYTTKNGSLITLNYTLDSPGYYNVTLIVTEYPTNQTIINSWPLIATSYILKNETFYLRNYKPKHAPIGISMDNVAVLSRTKPISFEHAMGSYSVFIVPDEPIYLPTVIESVTFNVHWKDNRFSNGYFYGIQRYGTLDGKTDQSISGTSSTLLDGTFTLNWTLSMPYNFFWYFIKLYSAYTSAVINSGGSPEVYTSPDNLSYVNFTIYYPKFLLNFWASELNYTLNYIKNPSGKYLLSLGNSEFNISLNSSNVYSNVEKIYVRDNGDRCPNANCDFSFSNGAINLHLKSSGVSSYTIGYDLNAPSISGNNKRYINSSTFDLNFTASDDVDSFSFVDFNHTITLFLPLDNSVADNSSHKWKTYGVDLKEIESPWGDAYEFNGYSSRIMVQNRTSTGTGVTVSAWIKPEHYLSFSWDTLGKNSSHNSYTNDELIDTSLLWLTQINGSVYTQPIYYDGEIFVGTYNATANSGELLALDYQSGTVDWSIDQAVKLTPLIYEGNLYFVNIGNTLFSVNPSNGVQNWNYTFSSNVYGIAASNGMLFVSASQVYALNASTGNIIWKSDLINPTTYPTVVGNELLVCSNGILYSLDIFSGKTIWKETLESGACSTPVYDGREVFVSVNGTLFALLPDGTKLWNFTSNETTPTGYTPPMPAADSNAVYFSWYNGTYALDKVSGSLLWNLSIGSEANSITVTKNYVYLVGTDGVLYRYYKNGTLSWNYTIGFAYSAPTVVNQELYVGSVGEAYAFGLKRSTIYSIVDYGAQSSAYGFHWLYMYPSNPYRIYWQYANGTAFKVAYCDQDVNLFDGNWHLVTVSDDYNKLEVDFYVDGKLKCSVATTTQLPTIPRYIYIGSYLTSAHFFRGGIDDVIVYNRSISASEASALFNSSNFSATITASDGTYGYTAYAVDEVSNVNSTSGVITVDTTAPKLSITSPSNCVGSNFTLNSSVSENDLQEFIYNISDDLVTYINFDEDRGLTLHDYIGGYPFVIEDTNHTNYDGNTPPQWSTGKYGYGLLYDGVDDIVYYHFSSIAAIPYNIKTFTVSFWMNPRTCNTVWSKGCGVLGGFGDPYWDSGFGFFYNGSVNVFVGYSSEGASDAINNNHYKYEYWLFSNKLSPGWHMLTLVYDLPHHNMTLYIDGKYNLSRRVYHPMSLRTLYLLIGSASVDPYWGTGQDGLRNVSFNGTLDQVMIWNRALTPKEIMQVYNYTYPIYAENYVLDKNLIGHFHFDEGNGTVSKGDTQYNNTVNLISTTTWGPGIEGSALVFDGNTSEAVVSNASLFDFRNNLTLSLWTKLNSYPSLYAFLIDKGYYYGYRLYILSNGSVCFQWNNGTIHKICGGYLPLNIWNNIVATYANGRANLYINGRLVAVGNFSGSIIYSSTNPIPIYIGHVNPAVSTSDNFTVNGSIDELMLFNRTLNDYQVMGLYKGIFYRYLINFTNANDGVYDVTATAQDYSGNWNSTSKLFYIDTEKPILVHDTTDKNNTLVCRNWEWINLTPIDLTKLRIAGGMDNILLPINESTLPVELTFNNYDNGTYYNKGYYIMNFTYLNAMPNGKLGKLIADFNKSMDGFNLVHAKTYILGIHNYAVEVYSTYYQDAYIFKNITGSRRANYTIWFYGKGYVNAGLYNGTDYVSYVRDMETGCTTPLGVTAVYNVCNAGNPYTSWHLFQIVKPKATPADVILRLINRNQTGYIGTAYAGQYDYVVDGPSWINDSFGTGLRFDGYGQNVSIPYPSDLSGNFTHFSIEIWLNASAKQLNSTATLISFGTTKNMIMDTNGNLSIEFTINGTTIPLKVGQAIPSDKATQVVIVYNGSAIIDYVNGVKEIYNASVGSPLNLGIATTDLLFGVSPTGDPFNGTIYSIRFYNKSLSDTEVSELYNGTELKDDLIGEWIFNKIEDDYLAHDVHMVANGIEKGGVYFDGANDILQSNDLNTSWKLQNFTVEAWVKFRNNVKSTWGLIVKGPYGWGYYNGWRLLARAYLGKAQYLFQLNNGTGTTIPLNLFSGYYPLDTWTFVAVKVNSTSICMYINGTLDSCRSKTGNIYYINNYPYFRLGGSANFLNGIIDDVKVYNMTLSDEQIKEDYLLTRDKYNMKFHDLTEGIHTFKFNAYDCCNNNATLNLVYHFVGEDFNASKVSMNNTSPKEGDTIFFNSTISNLAWATANGNVSLSIYEYNGSAWNLVTQKIYSVSIPPYGEVDLNLTWVAQPGHYKFEVYADPNNTIVECNESNNEKDIVFDVPGWATLYGNLSGYLLLGANGSNMMTWNPAVVSNVYVADEDSIFKIIDLRPLTNVTQLNDADLALNMTGFTDSITHLYDSNSDGLIDMWHNFTIAGTQYTVPVIYSDNSTNYYTGLVYDSADGSPYVGTQDLVIIGNVERNTSEYGVVDYVVKVPSKLQDLKGSTHGLYLYLEIT